MKLLLIIIPLLAIACLLEVSIRAQKWKHACRREAGKKWKCPTSNSTDIFMMQIRVFQKGRRKTQLWGTGMGPMPEKGEVLYLVNGETRIPVWICSVKEENMPEAIKGVQLKVTVLGAAKTEFTQETRLTNERDPKMEDGLDEIPENSEKAGKGKDPRKPEDLPEFPVKVRNPFDQVIVPLLLSLIGFLEAAACILEIFCFGNAGVGIGLPAFFTLAGIGFGIAGFRQFLKNLLFLVKITEEGQVSIRSLGGNVTYHIDNLSFENDWCRENKDTQTMQLFNNSGKLTAEISSTSAGYDDAVKIFSQAAKLRRKKNMYQYLAGTSFYIPAETFNGQNDGEQHTFPSIMENQTTGISSIFLFDNEDILKEDMANGEFNSILQVRLEPALDFLVDYQVLQLVFFLTDPELPETFIITKETREDIQKYIDEHRQQ